MTFEITQCPAAKYVRVCGMTRDEQISVTNMIHQWQETFTNNFCAFQ